MSAAECLDRHLYDQPHPYVWACPMAATSPPPAPAPLAAAGFPDVAAIRPAGNDRPAKVTRRLSALAAHPAGLTPPTGGTPR